MTTTDNTRTLLLVTLVLVLGACGGAPPKDIELQGELVASAGVNPNREGRASPLTVVIFHLKSADAFVAQDFFNLYNAGSGVLAADLIQRVDMQVQPGQTVPLAGEFDPDTTHIGVLAAFRDIDHAQWRAVVALPDESLKERLNPFSKKKLLVSVDTLSVTAEIK